MVKLNDIITNEDGSVYADTAIWCNKNGAMLREIEPIEKEVEEEYTEQIEVEHEQLIPERSHKEILSPVFDAEGNETEPEKEITVVDEEEHTETFTTTEEVTKTRTVKKTFRQFKVVPVPEPDEDEKKASVRVVRDQYLSDTDKYMLADFPISGEEREQYKAYRQYLRDYTEQENWWENNPETFETWRG